MKDILRKKFLNIRKKYKNSRQESVQIARNLLLVPEVRKSKAILLYYPYKNEVDIRFFANYLFRRGDKFVFFPRVSGENLEIIKVNSLYELEKGFAGIKEPTGTPYSPEVLDVVIVPGVAFDFHGYRLGYGGGFYDRFLKDLSAFKIGVAYDFQLVHELPRSEHDVQMDLIITPSKIVKPKTEKGGEKS